MSVCRTCLGSSPEKDFTDLVVNGNTNKYEDVIWFCLDIRVTQKGSTKLCLKCYENILLFYEFKSQAQKHDFYWRSLEDDKVRYDTIDNDIKNEDPFDSNFVSVNDDSGTEYDPDLSIKIEDVKYCESDNELLSVIKLLKYEDSSEVAKENEPVKRRYIRKTRVKRSKRQAGQVCEECGKTFRNLKDHMRQHQPLNERKRLKCKLCDKTFINPSARYKHYKTKHLGIKKRCHICSKEVISLSSHLLRVHEPSRLRYECAVCTRRFISQSVLAEHATVHSAAREHPCDQCDKAFRSKIVMLQHRRQVHDKEKSHLCQVCSKSFFKKYHLQVHLRTHSKEKPYECTECGKFFMSSTTLKNHKLLHTEYKMFRCTHCEMTFRTAKYLKVHMVSHSKVKKHPCKYCGVKFGRSDHRKRHERTAHEHHLLATAP